MNLAPGSSVGGRYRVVREIASGGMGTVYEVVHEERGATFALKVIKDTEVDGERTLERFRREAQLLDALEHPGVVKMVDAGLMGRTAFLVMELLDGETLLDFLRREAPVEPAALVPILGGAADALDAVHGAGVIHRDLKPSNVFLTSGGVKLVDFGLAQSTDVVRLTMTGQVVGTLRYMSPEQLEGGIELDGRADVYSLGLIVWAALAGRPPHGGTVAAQMTSIMAGTPRLEIYAPAIDRGLARVVHRAIAFEREERYMRAGAFAAAFEEAVGRASSAAAAAAWTAEKTGFEALPPTREAPRGRPAPDAVHVPVSDIDTTIPRGVRPRRSGAPTLITTIILASILGAALAAAAFFHLRPASEDGSAGASLAPPEGVAPVPVVAPPVAPTVQPSVVRVESDPAGALVEIDGTIVGNTPLELPAPTGAHTLTLTHPGYEPATLALSDVDELVEVTLVARGEAVPSRRGAMRRTSAPASETEITHPWGE